jgi:ribosome-associated protein
MDILQLQNTIIDALEDVKAQDIVAFDTRHLTSLFDCVVLASGTSNRQTRSLAMSVRDKVKTSGGDVLAIEGLDSGEWVLVDCNDVVVHIMQPMIREYYKLEQIWGDKPIDLATLKNPSNEARLKTSKKVSKAPVAKKTATPKPTPASKKTTATKKSAAIKKTTATKKVPSAKKTPTTRKVK